MAIEAKGGSPLALHDRLRQLLGDAPRMRHAVDHCTCADERNFEHATRYRVASITDHQGSPA